MRKGIVLLLLPIICFGFTWPINVGQYSAPLTSPFGPRLLNGHYDFHAGVDIRTLVSNRVTAVHEGLCCYVGMNGNYELMIFLSPGDLNYASGYGHLEHSYISLWDYVYEGDEIADAQQGYGKHLHFNFYTRNIYYTPPEHPHPYDSDTENPMHILPYTNYEAPEIVEEDIIVNGTDDNIESISVPVEISDTELDLNEINLSIFAIGDLYQNFDDRSNIGESSTYQWDTEYGVIIETITTYNFTPGTNQRLMITYDFSGIENWNIYGTDITFTVTDIEGCESWKMGFSALNELITERRNRNVK